MPTHSSPPPEPLGPLAPAGFRGDLAYLDRAGEADQELPTQATARPTPKRHVESSQRVLIAGSRGWDDPAAVREFVAALPAGTVVIHGDARGVDRLAGEAAHERGLRVERYPVTDEQWRRLDRRAGPLRNVRMLEQGQPDRVVAFWDGASRGTEHLLREAKRRQIPIEQPALQTQLDRLEVRQRQTAAAIDLLEQRLGEARDAPEHDELKERLDGIYRERRADRERWKRLDHARLELAPTSRTDAEPRCSAHSDPVVAETTTPTGDAELERPESADEVTRTLQRAMDVARREGRPLDVGEALAAAEHPLAETVRLLPPTVDYDEAYDLDMDVEGPTLRWGTREQLDQQAARGPRIGF